MNFPGGFPVDLVLFGLIAIFLILRLRSILGRRTGFEGRPPQAPPATGRVGAAWPFRGRDDQTRRAPPVIDGRASPVPPRAVRPLPDPASPLGQKLRQIQAADAGFDPARFLEAGENTFRSIVTAFASGDRQSLRALLTDETYQGFESAIAAREAAGETQRSEIRDITTAAIVGVEQRGSIADITLRFVSDQVNATLDRSGKPVNGTEGITELDDLWTFERDLAQPGQSWRLAAARSA